MEKIRQKGQRNQARAGKDLGENYTDPVADAVHEAGGQKIY